MIAYADASDITLFGWHGWLVLGLLLVAALIAPHLWDRDPTPTTCTAPLCTQPASLRISVGHEYLPMCAGCGIPLLTEGMKR